MKQLHLGNIANVAYGNCKILREAGQDAHTLCYDLTHVFSMPEFYDEHEITDGFSSEFIDDKLFYDRSHIPHWYSRIKSPDLWNTLNTAPATLKVSDDWAQALIRFSRRYGKQWTITEDDITAYRITTDLLSVYFLKDYDIVFGYAYAAIPPLIHALTPYVPVEIGTMRDIPFEDNSLGRLLALAYRTAPNVIITNPDVIGSIKRLELENYTFVPHPLDEETWCPMPNRSRVFHQKYDADYLLIAPARQNWQVKGNDKYFRAFKHIIDDKINAKLLVPMWGQDIDKSKQLIAELGLEQHVVCLNPMSEGKLRQYYCEVDLVLDQFGECRTFGLTAPKAMSCGAPVLITVDPEVHKWCFSEMPPLINVHTEKEIYQAIKHYLKNDDARKEIAENSRKWIEQHHSKAVIAGKFQQITDSIFQGPGARKMVFDSLKQKRAEITYEAAYEDTYDTKYHDGVAYQIMDEKLINILRNAISHIDNPKILDLGCGPGSLTNLLKTIPNAEITGVDISPTMVRLAQKKHPDVTFEVGDAEALGFEDGHFDVVFCSGILHHFPNLELVLQEAQRVLKDGGVFLAREPNETNFAARHPKLAFAHACLQHYIYLASNSQTLVEPEPHEYHISFTYDNFSNTVAKYFEVNHFYTDMMVSYFYDMLQEPSYRSTLVALDATLQGEPGLNIILTATKSDRKGIVPLVETKLANLGLPRSVSLKHYTTLVEFAESWFENYSQHLPGLADTHRFRTMRQVLRHAKPKTVLVCSASEQNQSKLIQKTIDEFSKTSALVQTKYLLLKGVESSINNKLFKLLKKPVTQQIKKTIKDGIDTLSHKTAANESQHEEQEKHFDAAIITVDNPVSADTIVKQIEQVKDYGYIILNVINFDYIHLTDKASNYFQQLTVIKENKHGSNGRQFLISRYLYTPADFYKALAADLADKSDDPEFAELLEVVNERLWMFRKVFSGLERLGRLKSLLETECRHRHVEQQQEQTAECV